MSLRNLKQLVEDCYDNGQHWESSFRKVPAIGSSAGVWGDLSMAPGNPRPNYYVGTELTSTVFNGSYGLFHGGDASPHEKHLHKIILCSPSAGLAPVSLILCDYLLFYPLVDMDSTDEQLLTTTTTLPRYADGVGVRAMLVATNPYIGGQQFYITYTDTNDETKNSRVHTSNSSTFIGSVVNCGNTTGAFIGNGPFIGLEQGTRGIKNIQSITFLGPNGGLAALVLVKPIVSVMLNEISASAEYDFLSIRPTMPRIYDGAYLNFVGAAGASWASAVLTGTMTTVFAS